MLCFSCVSVSVYNSSVLWCVSVVSVSVYNPSVFSCVSVVFQFQCIIPVYFPVFQLCFSFSV